MTEVRTLDVKLAGSAAGHLESAEAALAPFWESLRCPQHFSFCGACVEQPGWGFSGRAMKSFPRSVLTNWFKSHFQKFSMVNVENVLD